MKSSKTLWQFVVFMAIIFIFVQYGCEEKLPEAGGPVIIPNIQDTYSYNLAGTITANGIWTECDTCKFLAGEERNVYVYGKMPSQYYRTVTCYDQNNSQTGTWYVDVGANAFYDNINLLFTGPVLAKAPYATGFYTYTVVLSSSGNQTSNNFKVQVVSERNYPIEYSCQADANESYDLQTLGYQFGYGDFSYPIQVAFDDCNTTIVKGNSTDRGINVYSTLMQVEILHNISDPALITYGQTHASNGTSHDANVVVLFAVKDYDDPSWPKDQPHPIGRAVPSGISPTTYYCFVFMKTIDDTYSNHSVDDIKVLKTKVAIHELGHARRKESTHLSDDEEQLVHNGINKDYCVMHQGPMNFDPDKIFYFCEGHKQACLNMSW